MKTTILTLVMIEVLGLGQMMAVNTTTVDSEKDNTKFAINVEMKVPPMMVTFELEDEMYIDDIPFDTEMIVESYLESNDITLPLDMNFVLEDEEYIDDIPFNTELIAKAYLENSSSLSHDEIVFTLDEEEYIDDIPFDTETIYQCHYNDTREQIRKKSCFYHGAWIYNDNKRDDGR